MGDMADYHDPDGSLRHAMRFGGRPSVRDDDGPGLVPDDLNRMAARRSDAMAVLGLNADPRARIGTGLHAAMERYAETGRVPWDDDDRFPSEPPLGSVLRWTVRYPNGRELSVVGLRVPPGWYLSTNYHQGPVSWERVRELIGSFPCWVAVDWVEIPQPEPEPSGDDAVAGWAAQFRGADPVDGTPTDRVPAGSPPYYVSTAGERDAERDAADLTVAAAERDVERAEPEYPLDDAEEAPAEDVSAADRPRGEHWRV